jgi:hypothetical protein
VVIVRYGIDMATKDGKRISLYLNPLAHKKLFVETPIRAMDRGAFYSRSDSLLISDVFGFFAFNFKIPLGPEPRLLVYPRTYHADGTVPIQQGGIEYQESFDQHRSDMLTDHRPYIPGDDPRRINWKLYGHAGNLFIRQGEPEPPPSAKLSLIIDTSIDEELFSSLAGAKAVDQLTEYALRIALDHTAKGVDIHIGYLGGTFASFDTPTAIRIFAFPAAVPLPSPETELPIPEKVRSLYILALPRTSQATGALDRFLSHPERPEKVEMLFLGSDAALCGTAQETALRYSLKEDIHARHAQV